jgi:hypothetical protein
MATLTAVLTSRYDTAISEWLEKVEVDGNDYFENKD